MAIFSSSTIIRAISLAHITAAVLFLTSPKRIADQNVVFVLGESMKLVWQEERLHFHNRYTDGRTRTT